jgi:hypothetical protein
MRACATSGSAMIVRLLHALGIRDRACDDLLVVGLGTIIIFGLLAIVTLKTLLVRAHRLERERGPAGRGRPMARRSWFAVKALAGALALLAVALLLALRLDS